MFARRDFLADALVRLELEALRLDRLELEGEGILLCVGKTYYCRVASRAEDTANP